MPWIACEVTLPRAPKTLLLATAMGWSPKETVGNLLTLWGWCLDFAPDGDLSGFGHDLIADGIGISAVDGDRLLDALVKSRWVDEKPYLRIHDWWSLVGLFLRGRYQREPKRWQRVQKLYDTDGNPGQGAKNADSGGGAVLEHARTDSGAAPEQGKSCSGAALEQLYTTEHNSTVQNSTEPPPRRRQVKDGEEGGDDGSTPFQEDLKALRREIRRRTGCHISETDEKRLLGLLRDYGKETIAACCNLHGGIKNVPAYLSAVLEEKTDVANLIREAQTILKGGAGT